MKKKLTRHGNSDALVIEKPLMEILGLTSGAEVHIATDGHRLIIEAATPDARHKKLSAWLKKEHAERADVYRALSRPEA